RPDDHHCHRQRQHRQRQLDGVHGAGEAVAGVVGIAQRVGKLNDEYSNEHRSRQEEGIETGEQTGDEQDGPEKLGVRGEIAEEHRDVVAGEVGGERGGASAAEDLRVAVRDEDQAGGDAQDQRRGVRRPLAHVWHLLVPLSFFGSVYLATFLFAAWLVPYVQWAALVSVVLATGATILLNGPGRWRLGLAAPALVAVRDLLLGVGFAVVLIGVSDILIMASTNLRHVRGGGFPWLELIAVYLPAAVHEE